MIDSATHIQVNDLRPRIAIRNTMREKHPPKDSTSTEYINSRG